MKIKIADANRFGPLSVDRLEAFERSLGTALPAPYRRHLSKHNGGYVDGARRLCLLHHVFGVHDGPAWAQFRDRAKAYGGLVPSRLLPIADDPGGNLICLSLSGPDRGAVYFWDHESGASPEQSLTLLAPNFPAFNRGLAVRVALARKRMATVERFAKRFGVVVPVYGGRTILDLAVEHGSLRLVKMLVRMGASIGPELLIDAVRFKGPNTVRFLISRGADVNGYVSGTGFTALMLAASTDAADVVEVLLSHGADPRPTNRWGKTASDLARSDRVKELLRHA